MATIKQPIGRVQGERGETGPRNEVLGSVYGFTASDSPTTPPTAAEWLPVPPLEEQGKYVWCRSTITWQDGPDTTIYSVGYNGRDGSFNGEELVKAIEARVQELEDRVTPVSKGGLGTTTIDGAKAKLGIPEIISTLDKTHSAGINLLRGSRDFTIGTTNWGVSTWKSNGFAGADIPNYYTRSVDNNGFSVLSITHDLANTPRAIYTNMVEGFNLNDVVTFSFDFKIDNVDTFDFSSNVARYDVFRAGTTTSAGGINFKVNEGISEEIKSGVWYRWSKSISLSLIASINDGILFSLRITQPGSISFRKAALNPGNINNPTWSASPFDVIEQSDARVIRQVQQGTGQSVSNYVWLGRNIAELHKDTIGTQEPITWLKNIAAAGTFNQYDLQIGDYLECQLSDPSNTTMIYQLAGFDLYYGVGNSTVGINGHMITLVPVASHPTYVQFNTSNTNNGTSTDQTPWRASNLFKWCNETYYNWLPTAWKSALKDISAYQAVRYSSTGTLTDDNGGAWINLGKVWVPSEIEMWGSVRRSSLQQTLTDRHIPIFSNGRSIVKSRSPFWARVAAGGSSSSVCGVGSYGDSYAGSASQTNSLRALPCLHIG